MGEEALIPSGPPITTSLSCLRTNKCRAASISSWRARFFLSRLLRLGQRLLHRATSLHHQSVGFAILCARGESAYTKGSVHGKAGGVLVAACSLYTKQVFCPYIFCPRVRLSDRLSSQNISNSHRRSDRPFVTRRRTRCLGLTSEQEGAAGPTAW